MLEFKSNLAVKFLQLSVIKEGNRTFVIFPTGWNDQCWGKTFDSVAEIVGQSPIEPVLHLKGCHSQELKSKSFGVDPAPPPPPTLSLTTDLEIRSPMEPSSSLAVHENGEPPELPRRNGEYLSHVYRRQPHQVYVRRSYVDLTSNVTNTDSASNVEVVGAVEKESLMPLLLC